MRYNLKGSRLATQFISTGIGGISVLVFVTFIVSIIRLIAWSGTYEVSQNVKNTHQKSIGTVGGDDFFIADGVFSATFDTDNLATPPQEGHFHRFLLPVT
jgi:hypothetical protein